MTRALAQGWTSALVVILAVCASLLISGVAQAQIIENSTTVLTTAPNPSASGQTVTLTATVTNNDATTVPTGTVTFTDLSTGTTLGSVFLVGGPEPIVFTLNVSTLTAGSHSIQATYSGGTYIGGGAIPHIVNGSTSNTVVQVVDGPPAANVNVDSFRLRALQIAATKVVAQGSGQAISGAVDGAIADGFNDSSELITSGPNGLRFNFAAEPPSPVASRVDDAFSAFAYAPVYKAPVYKGPPRIVYREWLAWAEVRGSGVERGRTGEDLKGNQANVLAGITRRITPDVLLGAFGGYESFNYKSDAVLGRLKGEGWTVGTYLGLRLASHLRFDAAIAYSGLHYDGVAGTATGTFPGARWLASAGLTGMHRVYGFEIEPSARVYALWERENAYTDSLGTVQAARHFSTGRASAGVKLAHPIPWMYAAMLAPYVGLYADYHFAHDDALVPALALASTPILHGYAARVTGGAALRFGNGAQLTLGGEVGGIGNDFLIWTARARGSVPF